MEKISSYGYRQTKQRNLAAKLILHTCRLNLEHILFSDRFPTYWLKKCLQLLLFISLVNASQSLWTQLPYVPPELSNGINSSKKNALDLLITPTGYASLRYQRLNISKVNLLVDAIAYSHLLHIPQLVVQGKSSLGQINNDLRLGVGTGLVYWPWVKLHKAYLALRTQFLLQVLSAKYQDVVLSQNGFISSNSVEIGVRLGKGVISFGAFGGLGFQVYVNPERVLPDGFTLPMIYAYIGASFGFTF